MGRPFEFHWTGQDLDESTDKTFLLTDWDSLLDIAKQLSGDDACIYQGNYHAGGRHIVRRIYLPERGSLWLARVPTVSPSHARDRDASWWAGEQQSAMESEIATMKYIAQNTDVPVPEVLGYKTCLVGNPVKMPYLLMGCIQGNTLFDLGGRPDTLTPEQSSKICKSIASIQVRLANASLSRLGRLVLKADGEVDVGPLPATFGSKGPFDLTADYFTSWAEHNSSGSESRLALGQAMGSFPCRLKSSTHRLISPGLSSSYPIMHPDFWMHNLLLNDKYDVVGVIDWEFAHTVPIEVFAARTNMYAWFDPKRAALSWGEEGEQYLADVVDCERRIGMNGAPRLLSETFGSLLGDVGLCMQFYDEGRAGPFEEVLERAKACHAHESPV